MSEPTLQIQNFPGSVHTTGWFETPLGQKKVFCGHISVLHAAAVVGFAIRHHPEANWIAKVEGPTGESWYFPGCQVAAIISHPLDGRSVGGNEYILP
ncbi:MAG: hypothetical protein WBF51_04115 [Candidatus Dormiibacterota bacterium]